MPIGESDSAIVMKSASSSFFSGGGGGGLVGEECAAAGEVGRYAPGMSLSCGKLSGSRTWGGLMGRKVSSLVVEEEEGQ